MRIVFATMLAALAITAVPNMAQAQADPYAWCAHYGGSRGGGGSNCYFVTLGQCRTAVSGNGGFCAPNPFYTGGPAGPRRVKKRYYYG